jgi:hypothetical protein
MREAFFTSGTSNPMEKAARVLPATRGHHLFFPDGDFASAHI